MEQSTTPIQLIQLVRYKYFQVKLQIFSRLPLKNCPATSAQVIYSDGTKSPSSGCGDAETAVGDTYFNVNLSSEIKWRKNRNVSQKTLN